MIFKYTKKIKALLISCMFVLLVMGAGIVFSPNTARAQGATVPIGTSFDFNNIMKHLKDFVLDKLAYLVAKQILHQMTISVVNWINSGFQGNPAFLNNPAGFFEDAADQITGNFLTGPLQGLCSPFSLDIRLAIATQQINGSQSRYSCTLSRVIQAQQQTLARAQNGTLVNVNAGSSANGATFDSIVKGNILHDSNQLSLNGSSAGNVYGGFTNNFAKDGGWAGWIAMTSEPQNNMYGAYLTAKSDLAEQQAAKKAAIESDLNRGNGFLSYQDCKTISGTQAQQAANASGNTRLAQQLKNAQADNAIANISSSPATNVLGTNGTVGTAATQNLRLGGGSTIQSTVDSNGSLSYQDCQTVTPGSVLAGLTNEVVKSPLVEAELANDINAVLNALVSQMINTMLTKGLGALSGSGSGRGGHGSYTQSVIDDIQNQNNGLAQGANKQVRNQLLSSASGLQTYKGIYDQAVDAVNGSRDALLAAAACFTDKMASSTSLTLTQTSFGQSAVNNINSYIVINTNSLLSDLVSKQTDAANQIQLLANATTTAANFSTTGDSTDSTQALIDQVGSQVDQAQDVATTSISVGTTVAKGTAQANKDLNDAEKKAKGFNKVATQYQSLCASFPDNALTTGVAPVINGQ
jgi:hypothetical protein